MIQTADGALSVIDEKLIRMNELAEQAATGTYTDDQRAIIDQEYQTMADEITRISDSTDFNGQSLLNGSLEEGASYEDANGATQTGSSMTVHFGSGNDADEDKYSIELENVSSGALGVGSDSLDYKINEDGLATTQDGRAIYSNEDGEVYIEGDDPAVTGAPNGYTQVQLKETVADATEMQDAKDDLTALAETGVGTAFTGAAGGTTTDVDIDGEALEASFDATTGELTYDVGAGGAAVSIEADSSDLLIGGNKMYATIDADGTVALHEATGTTIPDAGYAVSVDTDGNLNVNVDGDDKSSSHQQLLTVL